MVAQIIDYPWATLRRSLYCRYTLLDEICFAALSPAFLFAVVQGYIDKGVGGQTRPINVICHLSSSRLSCVPPQTKVNLQDCIPTVSLCPSLPLSFNLKQFWSKSDLTFMVVTWGLPWQTPAVSNASLHIFL